MIAKARWCCSESRMRLVSTMQELNFGSIEGLHVRDGEPVFDPPPRTIKEFHFGGGDNRPRPELGRPLGQPKDEHLRLFQMLDESRSGVIARLIVRAGLPIKADFESN
ncbi:MAG: hypothetical protein H7Y88_12785 [Phycisphaerales bacterium]|nr:hypothetical protein [Phycisphaerales bacterium]